MNEHLGILAISLQLIAFLISPPSLQKKNCAFVNREPRLLVDLKQALSCDVLVSHFFLKVILPWEL